MNDQMPVDPPAPGDVLVDLGGPAPVVGGRRRALGVVAPHRGLVAAPWWQRVLKRAVDIVGATLGLVLLAPILLVAAFAVKVNSIGPVLYVSDRVGRGGRPFRMVKFRSMRHGAQHARDHHGHLNIHDSGPIFKIRDDPRVTPVGRFLRRSSLDELPQLWNVLRGDMSLVGPRPPLPEEFGRYGIRERRRLEVKPGITCIWQVSGRSDVDFDTWVAMDIDYIDGWSLRLDARLLARTVAAVVSRRGAY
jgi:lipopolysaccharide/colanic/teichoic acid biosynthesis glycosyltransferase